MLTVSQIFEYISIVLSVSPYKVKTSGTMSPQNLASLRHVVEASLNN